MKANYVVQQIVLSNNNSRYEPPSKIVGLTSTYADSKCKPVSEVKTHLFPLETCSLHGLANKTIRRRSSRTLSSAVGITATDGNLTSLKFCHRRVPGYRSFFTLAMKTNSTVKVSKGQTNE